MSPEQQARAKLVASILTDPDIQINKVDDTICMFGVLYTLALFRSLGVNGLPIGSHLKIIDRDGGALHLQRIYEAPAEIDRLRSVMEKAMIEVDKGHGAEAFNLLYAEVSVATAARSETPAPVAPGDQD